MGWRYRPNAWFAIAEKAGQGGDQGGPKKLDAALRKCHRNGLKAKSGRLELESSKAKIERPAFTRDCGKRPAFTREGTLGACAGHMPQPGAIVQPQDRYMDCPAITVEVKANNKKVQEIASEEGLNVGQSAAAGIAGFVPVLWFAMDWRGAANMEVAALQNRQQYLASLAEQRCVPDPD